LALAAGVAHAGSVWLPGIGIGGVRVPSIQSLHERRFSRTIHQQYDFSCGSAAVATLLSYQYDDPVSEQAVFRAMWANGNQAKIHSEGFSLLDIKHYLEMRGYVANGYKVPLDKLAKTRVPAIVLISDRGYNHFVVVKGLYDGRVLLGDPSRGARSVPRARFQHMLENPIVFVITSNRQQAVFNGRADWATRPLAPLGVAARERSLANATVLRAGPSDF
jgi:predicted double-glycine peptidase